MSRIVTYTDDFGETIKAMTEAEFDAHGPDVIDNWDDWVWHDQPDKATAIANHEQAFLAWKESQTK